MLTRRLISHIFQKLSGYFSKLALWTLQGAQRLGLGDIGWKVANHTVVMNSRWAENLGFDVGTSIDREIREEASRRAVEAFDVPKRFGET